MIDIKAWNSNPGLVNQFGAMVDDPLPTTLVKPWKIQKIDKPIRDAIEITISCTPDDPESGGAGGVEFSIRFLNQIHGLHQTMRFMEKLSDTARRMGMQSLNMRFTVTPRSEMINASLYISHDVFTPSHLWSQLALPICGLDLDDFPGSNLTSLAAIVVPSYEVHMSRANPDNQ